MSCPRLTLVRIDAERRAKHATEAQEIVERAKRLEEARRIAARGSRDLSTANAKTLEDAKSHLDHGIAHHRVLGRHHKKLDEQVRRARASLTGVTEQKALALKRCIDAMAVALDDADYSMCLLEDCLDDGRQAVQDVLDGVPEG